MPRWRQKASAAAAPPLEDVHLQLDIGHPFTDYSEAELRAAWEAHSEKVLADWHGGNGTRPWAWWKFEAGEEPPSGRQAERLRLAELDALSDQERRRLKLP